MTQLEFDNIVLEDRLHDVKSIVSRLDIDLMHDRCKYASAMEAWGNDPDERLQIALNMLGVVLSMVDDAVKKCEQV